MSRKSPQKSADFVERPPIIVVMGHIDHGKSALLDYIRKTNIVETETGGITQHTSAYEVVHKNKEGRERRITFLDTPGHEAFSAMRSRGAHAADIAILVVSAEEGVKAQTLEALAAIKAAEIPYVVAINKIDKPNANVEKTKNDLLANEVFLEGYGGDVPCVPISAKTGEGVPALLDMVLLVAEFEELKADPKKPAEGVVVESHVDSKKGVSATIVITDGTLEKGMFIVAGDALSPVRSILDCTLAEIGSATFSSPITITGFDRLPSTGTIARAYEKKRDAEEAQEAQTKRGETKEWLGPADAQVVIPLVLKTDVLGTFEAVIKELSKIKSEKVALRIIHKGVGTITENDVKIASGFPHSFIIGFRVDVDGKAASAAEKTGNVVKTFGIIYNITDFLEGEVRARTPKETIEERIGSAKILRTFSKTRDKQVLGARVTEGHLSEKARVKILRRDAEIGTGTILEIQEQKVRADKAESGSECGLMIESKITITEGDTVASFVLVTK